MKKPRNQKCVVCGSRKTIKGKNGLRCLLCGHIHLKVIPKNI
jgi:tRNA(Ile2) C34 agmatinyltransferase TiaS